MESFPKWYPRELPPGFPIWDWLYVPEWGKPRCWDCRMFDQARGTSRVRSMWLRKRWRCGNLDVPRWVLDAGGLDPYCLPLICDGFMPIMIDRCSCCERIIGQPRYTWLKWAIGPGKVEPVCSDTCQKIWNVYLREGNLGVPSEGGVPLGGVHGQ